MTMENVARNPRGGSVAGYLSERDGGSRVSAWFLARAMARAELLAWVAEHRGPSGLTTAELLEAAKSAAEGLLLDLEGPRG